jgi:prepilin-type N-terminal cleavage/methylation domain-containing protein
MTDAMTETHDRGFTLLEMVCVIALISMLVAVLLPFVPRHTSRSRLQAFALEAATLLKADRNAAIQRQASSRSGQLRDFRWQVDVGPVGGDWDPGDADVAWIPELVTIRVRSASGATVDLKTVRLMRRPQQ